MPDERLRVGVVFGGISAEHEVSWVSARNVIRVMDRQRYRPVPILIDQAGRWFLVEPGTLDSFSFQGSGGARTEEEPEHRILLDPEGGKIRLVNRDTGREVDFLDLVFPLVHGTCGEDGTLQGLCKLFQIPFVGPGVAASAACMDKDIMKRILLERGIPVAEFVSINQEEAGRADPARIARRLGLPLFVKPANLGSSVGITKAKTLDDLPPAMAFAFQFDEKIIVEESVQGREIECSVLGNQEPEASIPGEIVPRHEFYSYQAKYEDPEGAELRIPADLEPAEEERVRELALRSFKAMECEGMARVDFFLRPDGSVLVNELNTIPGFTDISMYPKLWEASGVPCGELVHRLIQLGLERYHRETRKSHVRDGNRSVRETLS